ncbi:hypothetical protein [Williamsia sp. CHRR-6]|uniref:hypothetical protein n=1 Tax=Williamsia sp. CHRR-6 TaxID=2835871 RepID=UPI001BDAC1F3|nr:hypothetical protein [Williamsia sp. CHRR-6]MBT0568629.1 hypothetical protein [Williamsia sp. CHRR-6]
MTNAELGSDRNDSPPTIVGRSGLGKSESIAYRLWLLIALTGLPTDEDSTYEILAERLSREGCSIRPRTIRAHLSGTVVPTRRELDAYGPACEWFANNAVLAEDPRYYLKPLIQAEMFMCTHIIGSIPLARGRDTPHGLDAMSVPELRAYRAELLSSGRLELVST